MIVGQHVHLRPVERDDLPRFVDWFGDPEVYRYLSHALPFSMAQEERWFERLQEQLEKRQVVMLNIETTDGTHIGTISLSSINWTDRHAELGIAIGEKDHWGQGYGSDAIRTLLRVAFDDMNLHRIFLHVHVDNARGIRCYQKVGFQKEGTLREAVFRGGSYHDEIVMGILESEFERDV